MNQTNHTILLTIDVEDWFQVENLRSQFPPETWDHQNLRVERNIQTILDILDSVQLEIPKELPEQEYPARPFATFFILGWIAKRLPRLVREIQTRGHEVASHGYNHLMCTQLGLKDLKEDLIRSKSILEDITGNTVNGYRAPNFSISDAALELILDCGYKYDSSYNSFGRHGRYGTITLTEDRKTDEAIRITPDFAELPISNLAIAKQIIPWGGGGYFRFLPLKIFKFGVKRILQKTGIYTFYLHPWEIDPYQPKVKNVNSSLGLRHYFNITKTQHRLQSLILSFNHCRFMTCSRYLKIS